jgi:F0F1-type ATP synthase assembly protein I
MTSPPPDEPPEPVKPLPGAMAFVGLGTTAAGCVAVGVGGGIALDSWLHTSPLFLVVGLVLGVAAAVGSVVAQVRRYL